MTHASLISGLLPVEAACHECPPEPDGAQLHPLEERHSIGSRMSDKRRREYELGRWCARQAMSVFDRGEDPLLTGPSRAPIWPEGLIGSITHCQNYCAAAVAPTRDLIAIGIDAEPWGEVPLDIQPHIAATNECAVSTLNQSDPKDLALIFSAKESIFKALNPLLGIFFDFLSVTISVNTRCNSFHIISSRLPEIETFKDSLAGRFIVTNRFVVTSAFVRR